MRKPPRSKAKARPRVLASAPPRIAFPSSDALMAAAREVEAKLSKPALVGGLAMQLYGSPRLTADVDIAAPGLPKGAKGKALTFGGLRTKASNGIEVDIIVRDDDYEELYKAACHHAIVIDGLRVTTKEYLVILKMVAGRPKDEIDARFLCSLPEGQFDDREAWKIAKHFLGPYGAGDFRQLRSIAQWEKTQEKDNLK
jgi:hypothetical protein